MTPRKDLRNRFKIRLQENREMLPRRPEIEQLREYFENRDDTLMAFLFGSQIKENHSKISDWDIACYFTPFSNTIEWEKDRSYPEESKIWSDLTKILETVTI